MLGDSYGDLPGHLWVTVRTAHGCNCLPRMVLWVCCCFSWLIFNVMVRRAAFSNRGELVVGLALKSAVIAFLVTGFFNHNLYIAREASVLWMFVGLYLVVTEARVSK